MAPLVCVTACPLAPPGQSGGCWGALELCTRLHPSVSPAGFPASHPEVRPHAPAGAPPFQRRAGGVVTPEKGNGCLTALPHHIWARYPDLSGTPEGTAETGAGSSPRVCGVTHPLLFKGLDLGTRPGPAVGSAGGPREDQDLRAPQMEGPPGGGQPPAGLLGLGGQLQWGVPSCPRATLVAGQTWPPQHCPVLAE